VDITFTIAYRQVTDPSVLNDDQQLVIREALLACGSAYAPYSDFPVGAALLLEDQSVLKGSNQENASYPCGICAERNVLFHYGSSSNEVKIKKIAIAVAKPSLQTKLPAAPCGLCRQVMAEYEYLNQKPIEVILAHQDSAFLIFESCQSLLPFWFSPSFLSRGKVQSIT